MHLLLLFRGATTTYTAPVSGGFQIGGSAPVAIVKAFTASGGFVLGGSAATSFTSAQLLSGGGGVPPRLYLRTPKKKIWAFVGSGSLGKLSGAAKTETVAVAIYEAKAAVRLPKINGSATTCFFDPYEIVRAFDDFLLME